MGSSAYPKGSFILLAMTAFEAGAFGIFIVLNPIFWRESVGVGEKAAGDANFAYGFLLNFTPLITAFLADNYWGRYAVLGLHCVCFVIGFSFVTASSLLSLPYSALLGAFALLLVSTAVGINKVILPTFNADQFQGHNEETRNKMFSWYYFAVNLASIVSIIVVGNLKDYISCFGKPCYPFVYGLCTALVLLSTVLFFAFSRWFVRVPASNNVLVEAVKCMIVAVRNRLTGDRKGSSSPKRSSLLDYAQPVYSEKFIGDLKQALKVASLFFIGIPYWTCYQTMFSSWSRQYSLVDGSLGPLTVTFLMYIILDPITIVFSIFLQNNYIIPLFNKVTTVTPLKKMAVGGLCAAICFAFVTGVEYKISEDELKPLERGARVAYWKQSSLADDCQLHLARNESSVTVPHAIGGSSTADLAPGTYEAVFSCPFPRNIIRIPEPIVIEGGVNILAVYPSGVTDVTIKMLHTPYGRLDSTKTEVNLLSCRKVAPSTAVLISAGVQSPLKEVPLVNCNGSSCTLAVNLSSKSGAKIVFFDDTDCSSSTSNSSHSNFFETTAVPGYSVPGTYMWPQNIIFGLSESLLAVGALEFAYAQTSSSMKAFMQALWLLTAALGNILGFLLNQVGMSPFLSHTVNGGIMFLTTLVFIVGAWRYRYVQIEEDVAKE